MNAQPRTIVITVIIIFVWAAIFLINWSIAIVAFPLIAIVVLYALFAPPLDLESLAELKSPFGETQSSKTIITLNGQWKYKTGLLGHWHPVPVPADLCGVPGLAWKPRRHYYRRRVDLTEPIEKGRVFLCLNGAGGEFRVFVNKQSAGGCHYGFAPSEIEITELIKNKTSFDLMLEIKDAHKAASSLNPSKTGSAFGKGLFGSVFLKVRPKIFIRRVQFAMQENGNADAMVTIEGASQIPVELNSWITQPNGCEQHCYTATIKPFSELCNHTFTIPNEQLSIWNPAKPCINRLRIRLESAGISDEREEIFGWNFTGWKGGAPGDSDGQKLVGLKFMNFLPPYGAALPEWAVRRDVRTLADAGFNLLWTVSMPPTRELLDICDHEGLFVVGEIALSDVIGGKPAAADMDHTTGWMCDAAHHPGFLFWYIRKGDGKIGFSRSASAKITKLLNEPALRGRVMLADDLKKQFPSAEETDVKIVSKVVMPGITIAEEITDAVKSYTCRFILNLDHLDGSLGMEPRRVRDSRRAYFDTEILPLLEDARCAGLVLGTMIFAGSRIGLLTETRRPALAFEACRQYLKSGKTIPAAPPHFRTSALPHLRTLSIISFIAALALLATKPFLADFIRYPYNIMSFMNFSESALLRIATAAGFAFAAAWRLHAQPVNTINAFVGLPPFIYRTFLRRLDVKFLAFFMLWLYSWFAGTWLSSLLESRAFLQMFQITAQVSVFDLFFLFLFFTNVPGVITAGGVAAVEILYLTNMVSPAVAVIYGVTALSIGFYLFYRIDYFTIQNNKTY